MECKKSLAGIDAHPDQPKKQSGPPPVGLDAEKMGKGSTPEQVEKFYRVPALNMASLQARIEKLKKKADKLQTGSLGMEIVGQENVENKDGTVNVYYQVRVWGQPHKINGWRFGGTLQHAEGGNIVRSLPGVDVPEDFRQKPPACSHCQKKRHRKDTYLVVHDDGTVRQVGRTCLKDFTGHPSPETAAAMAELLLDACEQDPEEDYIPEWGRGASHVNLKRYLAVVAGMIRKYGWTSKSNAGMHNPSTADVAINVMLDSEEPYEPSDEDVQEAQEALNYLRENLMKKEKLSDYEWNLLTVIRSDAIEWRELGLAASAITAYHRAVQKEALHQKKLSDWQEKCAASQHLGEVGQKKFPFSRLTVTNIYEGSNDYGPFYIISMADPSGNVVVWKTSSPQGLEVGRSYAATATIKAHDEYKGLKQTAILRPKFELIEEAEAD